MKGSEELRLAEVPTMRPDLLDVVSIDGRWAQVRHGGGVICFLSDNTETSINWDDYEYVPFQEEYPRGIADKVFLPGLLAQGRISKTEYDNVRWNGQSAPGEFNDSITVFGQFRKKT